MFSLLNVSKFPPKNYFAIQIAGLKWFGITLVEKESTLYKIYSVLCFIVLAISTTLMDIQEMIRNRNNLDVLAVILTYGLTHVVGMYDF